MSQSLLLFPALDLGAAASVLAAANLDADHILLLLALGQLAALEILGQADATL
jgi:hypothetical protein